MKERVNNRKRIIPIEIKAILIIVILLFVGLLTTYILKSYAKFEKKESHNIINAKVGEFYKEFAYTGSVQEYTVPTDGYYEVELWGGKGITEPGTTSGSGGYTRGTIYLEEDEVLYFYVGEQGLSYNTTCASVGWNGGGSREQVASSVCGPSGGGATDVRLIKASASDNTLWNNSESLRSRIMVAGAGGGGRPGADGAGGNGGSLIGKNGIYNSSSQYQGEGGTQTYGGKAPTKYSGAQSGGGVGSFGIGGTGGRNALTSTMGGGAGGGAGYYGGSGASGLSNGIWSGGGGSSYISGYSGVNSVQQSGGTAVQPLHTNNTIHYSNKYFINGSMESGVNNGNGKAKIRYVRNAEPLRVNTKLNNVRYIKDCVNGHYPISAATQTTSRYYNQWVELQAIKDGENLAYGKTAVSIAPTGSTLQYSIGIITDGDIDYSSGYYEIRTTDTSVQKCIQLDLGSVYNLDEISVWHYWGDSRLYYDQKLSVSSNGTTWTDMHSYSGTTGYAETSQGRRYNAWNLTAVE